MSKTLRIYIVLLILLFAGAFAIEFSKPKQINWSQTYNETHKRPYGTYILYNELQNLFKESQVEDIRKTPYEYFNDLYDSEDSTYLTKGNYLFIDRFVDTDQVSSELLLNFSEEGNNIFISSNYPPEIFKDSLNFDVQNDFNLQGKAVLSFANNQFKNDSITIEKGLNNIYISEVDSSITTVLGYQKFDSISRINFIKITYGKGNIFIHLQPAVFTNYQLLQKDNKKYAAAALSYLPEDTLFYDSRNKSNKELGDSVMRYILKQPALKWAWFMALITLIFFMVFNAKRKQRVVKVIKPLENTTVAFTKTIGNLYYETKDHDNLIDKKITYFLEYIRRVYYLDTQLLDEKFIKFLSLKSGKNKVETKKLIDLITYLRAKRECTENDLLRLNKSIEDFYTT